MLLRLRALAAVALLLSLAACGGGAPSPPRNADLTIGGDGGAGELAIAASPPSEPVAEDDGAVPVANDDPVRGNRLALVTVVVFSDFQCPFCGRLATTLSRVQEVYADDVRFVFKNEPLAFHPFARLAAETGEGVRALKGNEAFWRYHDLAFRGQSAISAESIRGWAIAAGADARELDDGLARHAWSDRVRRDEALAQRLGVNGTPGSFVNGVSVSGAVPFETWKEIIDAELGKARALVQQGTPRDRVYARMAAMNFEEAKLKPAAKDDDDDDNPNKPDTTVWKATIGASPTRGSSSALVTIVEFSDFQCPYCKKVQPTLERLRTEYGDRLRLVWKDSPLPFHPRAIPAALLARSARAQKGESAFWSVHDKLFASTALEDSDLAKIVRAANLDAARVDDPNVRKALTKGIDDDMALGEDLQASGTPHFFVNGHRLVGAQPYDRFKTVIDAELAKAEALVRGGVAKAAIYEAIMKTAKGAPEPDRKAVAASTVGAPFRGVVNAKVVVEEFSDFQCPFCSRVEPTVDELLKAYPGKIKVVWRNLPLPMHQDAELAAEAAREAFVQKGNDGFSKMRALLFEHQRDQDGLKRTALESYASTVGLDLKKFGKALDDGTHKAAIAADKKAADDAGISGTPAFTVGPYYVSGAQPLSKFKKLVDRVLVEPAMAPPPPVAGRPTIAVVQGGTIPFGSSGPTTTLPGGLITSDVAVGSGAAVKAGDTVTVHYVGTLVDGTEFDSSRKHSQPFTFTVGQGRVIKGWDTGLVGMKVGGRRKLTIPPDMGYGDRGAGATIPPKSTLLFDIELLSIK